MTVGLKDMYIAAKHIADILSILKLIDKIDFMYCRTKLAEDVTDYYIERSDKGEAPF